MIVTHRRWAVLSTLIIFSMLTAGCATKKFVRKLTDPLETRLGKNETKTAENTNQIQQVDARAQEGITSAQSKADSASEQAAKAGEQAQNAQTLAQSGVDQAKAVDQKVENSDNFQTVKTATVLFGFDKSALTEDDQAQLDQLADTIKSMKHYVIEVQGYTDKTGPAAYNLQLSRRRADAVVRYLTVKHNIPLVKISLLGYGEEAPAAPNTTRDGRKENRRVEIRVLAPQWAAGQVQAQSQPATATAEMNKK
jgi:OmpA-OmpF porin, OOP family